MMCQEQAARSLKPREKSDVSSGSKNKFLGSCGILITLKSLICEACHVCDTYQTHLIHR